MALSFNFYTPTEIVFGKGAELQTGSLIAAQGCKKALIVYGGNSAVRSGLIDTVKKSLEEAGVAYVTLGGVVPNPHLSLVYEGIELGRKEGTDFILAVGGGSVIDTAKAISYGILYDGDVWDFYDFKAEATKCLPVGSVLTIAAAGSETSMGSVITDERTGTKRAFGTYFGRPKFAIMNPELTMTLPDYQTQSGAADILMHTMERYFTEVHRESGTMEITDVIAEGLLRVVMKNAKILHEDPRNYDARAELMWAGSLSHNGLTGIGTDGGDWACHQLEHEIGGMFDVAHGAGLAALWGSWARYVYKEDPARFVQFAVNVHGVTPGETDEETIMKGIEAQEAYFRSVNMPTSIKELGIEPTDAQLREMAERCYIGSGGAKGSMKLLQVEDMYQVYKAANH